MKPPFSFLGRRGAEAGTPEKTGAGLPMPDRPTYIVGDLHGCADLLEKILGRIDAHIGEIGTRNPHLVFVGDYIDRGRDGAAVLRRLNGLTAEFPDNVVCLMGNHEKMLLDFLEDPPLRGARWLKAGGDATLFGFGVSVPTHEPQELEAAAESLRLAMTDELRGWVAGLPTSWRSGNLWVVHAAADPMRPMEEQRRRVLLWGHPDFQLSERADGVWVAHGHAEIAQAQAVPGRINVDTGAHHTGRLSACAILPDGRLSFLSTDD